jgi:hypothetical protein
MRQCQIGGQRGTAMNDGVLFLCTFLFTLAIFFLLLFFCSANHYIQFRLDYMYGMGNNNDEAAAIKDDKRRTEVRDASAFRAPIFSFFLFFFQNFLLY